MGDVIPIRSDHAEMADYFECMAVHAREGRVKFVAVSALDSNDEAVYYFHGECGPEIASVVGNLEFLKATLVQRSILVPAEGKLDLDFDEKQDGEGPDDGAV